MPDASPPDPPFFSDFFRAFSGLLSEAACQLNIARHGPRGGGAPKLSPWQWIMARVYHELARSDTLAAAFGWQGGGELTPDRRILARQSLPYRCRILADRLFGIPSLMWELMPMLGKSAAAALFRIKFNLKVTRIRQLTEGSWLVSIPVIKPGTRLKIGPLLLREIKAEIHCEGGAKPLAMRLWTSLPDENEHPATASVEPEASRWEEKLFFRELKSHLHGCDSLLEARTRGTAARELLAMLPAASLVAMQREVVAERAGVEILRISVAKVLHKTAAPGELLAVGGDLIGSEALTQWLERILEDLPTSALIQKRKPRSCPRTLRQPTKDWPKTKTASSEPFRKTIVFTNP